MRWNCTSQPTSSTSTLMPVWRSNGARMRSVSCDRLGAVVHDPEPDGCASASVSAAAAAWPPELLVVVAATGGDDQREHDDAISRRPLTLLPAHLSFLLSPCSENDFGLSVADLLRCGCARITPSQAGLAEGSRCAPHRRARPGASHGRRSAPPLSMRRERLGRRLAEAELVLSDRRQRGLHVRRELDVVEADDGEVVRARRPRAAAARMRAGGHQVRRRERPPSAARRGQEAPASPRCRSRSRSRRSAT